MKSKFFIILLILSSVSIFAQDDFGTGCDYDIEFDGNAPRRARLVTRDYVNFPQAYSIKKYCPTPKSQSQYGTCTSWATGYAARTICEAIANNWSNTEHITKEAFSPIFVYKNIEAYPSGCKKGTSIGKALALLKKSGTPKFNSFDFLCVDEIPNYIYEEAKNYTIDDYSLLFDCGYDWASKQWNDNTSASQKITSIKKAITQNRPVVIAMDCYHSFSVYGEDLWTGVHDKSRGSHAMCVVGYDDNKYGGAFEIMNSWGTNWGKDGFIWVSYDTFCLNTHYAYDVTLNKKVEPAPSKKKYSFDGEMYLQEMDGHNSMKLSLKDRNGIMYYHADDNHLSGTRFRLIVSNNKPAWVYVLASDQTNEINKLFPYAENVSANLNYTTNTIALPDETHEFEFDSTAGTDYFCILYSQNELPINEMISQITRCKGSFLDRINTVLSKYLALKSEIAYTPDKLAFKANSDNPVVPLIVEIPHKGIEVKYSKQ